MAILTDGTEVREKPRPDRLLREVVVVTGAASGIGLAIALRCLSEGAQVVAVDRDKAGLEKLSQADGALLTFEADVRDEARAAEIMRELDAVGVTVTSLVASAGWIGSSSFLDASLDHWRNVLDINLLGSVLWARVCAPPMLRAGKGSIVLLASQLLQGGGRDSICYITSKGAVRALGRSLALEFGPQGIRVNILSPGPTDTPMMRDRWNAAEDPRAAFDRSSARPALRRVGKPEEIAAAACFLLSDEASYVTGAELLADGGYSVG